MGKIKIGFVANDLTVGGVSAVLINLCNKLDKETYEIHLILLSSDVKMEEVIPLSSEVKKHIFQYRFSDKYSLLEYLKTAFNSKKTSINAAEVLKEISALKLDILHFHTLPRQLKIGQLAQKNNPQLKLVYTDHLTRLSKADYNWYQKPLLEMAYRRFYKNYNLIAVSKAVYDSIIENKRFDRRCELLMLENSIELSAYQRKTPISQQEKKQFIYVSRMNHHKGQVTLIEAWQKLTHPQKGKLVLVGPDESNGDFLEMANGDSSIEFAGSVSNVKDYLENSSIAVFPSQKEGLPIALLEKMAYELPIICSDIPELTSIIENNVEGLHFKVDDANDLKEKLEFALENETLMIEMGKKARQKAKIICENNDPMNFHNSLYSKLLNA